MPRRKQDRPQRMKWDECEPEKSLLPATEVPAQEEESETPARSSSSNSSSIIDEVSLPQEKVSTELMNYSPVSSLSLESPTSPVAPTIPTAKEEVQASSRSVSPVVDTPLDFSLKKSLSKRSPKKPEAALHNGLSPTDDAPLDLSVPRRRRKDTEPRVVAAKVSKLEIKPKSPWGYCSPRALTPPTSSSKSREVWNGRNKTKHDSNKESHKKSPWLDKNVKGATSKNDLPQKSARQNPWQSQWISRSSDQTKDVFTCVWCKESFKSLSDMTLHMKQSPQCGVTGIQSLPPVTQPPSTLATASVSTPSSSSVPDSVVKETVSLPRKLVRGQDVWLGKGAEQTRQILKCMWCGQSFKSLADMTTHMRVTQHYTNIISQEQIISWRTPEDKIASQSHVNAVLTCKVCDQAFGSLKELSYHMVKNSHYKEHILRSITDGGARRRQNRERRKKSLPVRKLLELERMEVSRHGQSTQGNNEVSPKKEVVDGKITCEECTERVDAKDFVQHIKKCGQGGSKNLQEPTSAETPQSEVPVSNGPAESPVARSPSSEAVPTSETLGTEPSSSKLNEEAKNTNDSTSVLNAIERLIEKSFEMKGRRMCGSTGILQRLGIDEELCPPWQPSVSPSVFYAKPDAVVKSPSCGSLTPGPSYEEQPLFSNLSPRSSSSGGLDQNSSYRELSRTSSPMLNPCNSDTEAESTEQAQLEATTDSVVNDTSEALAPAVNGVETAETPPLDENSRTSPSNKTSSYSAEQTRDNSEPQKRPDAPINHPLKELQKLLDKTDTHMSRSNQPTATQGSILAFSWACTESNSNDSHFKCAFCDTHFVSKGAYRHHLSKTHFIKDGNSSDLSTWPGAKTPQESDASNVVPKDSPTSTDESPHSKFLKYTELAKQLSSKYV